MSSLRQTLIASGSESMLHRSSIGCLSNDFSSLSVARNYLWMDHGGGPTFPIKKSE